FSTLKEIKQQFKAVPEKKKFYAGGGGVPISRYKNKIYVDDSPVNNLWIGTTRSGKGEMGVFPMIDIYSRAEEQASMIINDPKGELYTASKQTLEERGYHVEVLNLENPLKSMSYNLLQIVIEAYEDGDLAKAEQYAKSISHMFYNDPSAKDKMWQRTASSVCTALILGLCEKFIPDQKEKITMYTVATTLNKLGSESDIDPITGEETLGLDKFFNSLGENSPARLQYGSAKFASGAGETLAGILTNAYDMLSNFTLTPIAKMTSMNTFDMKKVGFGKSIKGFTQPLKRVYMYIGKEEQTIEADENGLFTFYHDAKLDVKDEILLKVDKTNIELKLQVTKIDPATGTVEYVLVSEKKEEGVGIEIKEIEYFNKPTAIFMITPDYDSSFHIIASLYIKQLYTELARTANNTKNRKTLREVIFILDEFGNMPAIDDMGNIITVCLGRNIRFNLVVQSYAQLKQKYDKDWETIDGNCANTIYILTTSNETAEEVSKKIGEKTIESSSRSGSPTSLSKSQTEGTEGRRLLTADELRRLKEGEMVVIRGIKRQDLQRGRIKPYPIYNTKKTAIKYRWEYLSEYFDTDKYIHEIDVPCAHATVDLKKLRFDYEGQDEIKEQEEEKQEKEQEHETIKDIFGDDTVFSLIKSKMVEETDYTEKDIQNLSPKSFMTLLTHLRDEGYIATNLYNSTKNKYDRLLAEQESTQKEANNKEESEDEALPM